MNKLNLSKEEHVLNVLEGKRFCISLHSVPYEALKRNIMDWHNILRILEHNSDNVLYIYRVIDDECIPYIMGIKYNDY